jgi:hypothetical protein
MTVFAIACCLWISMAAQGVNYVKVTLNNADVHADPDGRAPVLERLVAGTFLEQIGMVGEFYRVRLPRNPSAPAIQVFGWIRKSHVVKVDQAALAAAATEPKPPGEGMSVGVDHAGKSTWLKPSGTRAVAISERVPTVGTIATSPDLQEALTKPSPARFDAAARVIWVWVTGAGTAAPSLGSARPSCFLI